MIMKKMTTTILLAAVLAAGTVRIFAQPSNASPPKVIAPPVVSPSTPPAATENATAAPTVSPVAPGTTSALSTKTAVVPATNDNNTNELRLNFRGVPLDMVLSYLSDAAGFIIVLDTQVHGNVDVWSDRPVTKDEAVNLLNSVLNKNGYAAIRNGRTLTIMDKNDAKTRDIPVKIGNDPAAIPNNDEMVTQIIPIRFVEAKQLVADLSPFVSSQATIVANEAGNSIVITDTQSNIRHLAEIIKAIDNSAQGETEIRVFALKYANPADVAAELGQIFPNSSNGNSQSQLPFRFGGRGGGGPGGFFARMMAANGNNNQNSQIAKQTQVVAVADARTQSVIVTATKDLMDQIAGMMEQLDVPSDRDQGVYVFQMKNGDPQQAAQVLQNMFQSSTATRGNNNTLSSQNSALQQRAVNATTSMGTTSTSTTGNNRTGTGVGGGNVGRQF